MDDALIPHSVEKIKRLELALLDMPQAPIKTFHKFSPGLYERTVVMPPWTVATGAIHKDVCTVRLSKGSLAVSFDDGVKVLSAPCEFESPAGVKRVVRVFDEEVVWTDVYANADDCTDLEVLEERLFDAEGIELGDVRQARMIEQAQQDYLLFLEQLGMTQEQMDVMLRIDSDHTPMPEGFDVEVRPSIIHGHGVFVTREFDEGEFICPGRIDGCRTFAGRFTNHSHEPNAIPYIFENEDIALVALRPLQANEEVLIDYRASMRVNFGITVQGENTCQLSSQEPPL